MNISKEKKYKKFFNSKKAPDNVSTNNNLKGEISNLSSLNSRPQKLSFHTQLESNKMTKSLGRNTDAYFLDLTKCNNNNNSAINRFSVSETCLNETKYSDPRKYSNSLEKFNVNKSAIFGKKQLEIDDQFLNELNKKFENLMDKSYADACISIYYFEKLHSILIMFHSLINLSSYNLKKVNVVIDVFHKEKRKKRLLSKLTPVNIQANEETSFKHTFLVKLNHKMNIKTIILNVYLIGGIFKEEPSQSETDLTEDANFLLTSKSSLSDMQILGGAHILVKNFL